MSHGGSLINLCQRRFDQSAPGWFFNHSVPGWVFDQSVSGWIFNQSVPGSVFNQSVSGWVFNQPVPWWVFDQSASALYCPLREGLDTAEDNTQTHCDTGWYASSCKR